MLARYETCLRWVRGDVERRRVKDGALRRTRIEKGIRVGVSALSKEGNCKVTEVGDVCLSFRFYE